MQGFTIEEFKKIHQAWKECGLNVRDYCANTGFKESCFPATEAKREEISVISL